MKYRYQGRYLLRGPHCCLAIPAAVPASASRPERLNNCIIPTCDYQWRLLLLLLILLTPGSADMPWAPPLSIIDSQNWLNCALIIVAQYACDSRVTTRRETGLRD
jgi:hypothetical protein